MKDALAAVELFHLLGELRELVDGSIDKIYVRKDLVLLSCYTGQRRVNLVMDLPGVLYLSENKPSFGKASGYAMYLRKRLQGARFRAVEQLGMDRVLRFTLQTKEETLHWYVELFGKGNLILTDTDGAIRNVRERVVFKDRELRQGETYQLPELQADPRSLSDEELSEVLSAENVEKSLAVRLGLGGEYASLVLGRMEERDVACLREALEWLLSEKDPQVVDSAAYPVRVSADGESFATFSAAIAAVWDDRLDEEKDNAEVVQKRKAQSKVEAILTQQEKSQKKFEKRAEEDQRRGELLYERFQEISEMLTEAAKDRKGLSPEAFTKKWEKHPLVVSADPQRFEIELE